MTDVCPVCKGTGHVRKGGDLKFCETCQGTGGVA